MANLSVLNRLMKFQKLLLTINGQSGTVPASNSYAAIVLLKQQQKHTNCTQTAHLPRCHRPCYSVFSTIPAQHYNYHYYSTSTSSSKGGTTTLDEFREREQAELHRDETAEKTHQKSKQTEDDAKRSKVDEIRTKILEAALTHVPVHGWTRNAIIQGAEDIGFPSVVHGMFPEGGFALVAYFNGKSNEALVEHLKAKTDNGQKTVADPIEFLVCAVRVRLEMIEPFKQQWPQALALIALPQNASTALAQVLTLVDDICYYSGDRSVDIGWYTRRIGLATILKTTELYMLQDTSPMHASTWEFLANRMDEAVKLQTLLMQTGDMTSRFQRSFNSAFITARNILGLGYDRN